MVQVDRRSDPVIITVRTWNDANEADIGAVESSFAAMNERADAAAYYQDQLEASLEREGSGLGLPRICAEGEMTMSCEREGTRICVTARARAPKRT